MARYFYASEQQDYEKMCHFWFVEEEKRQLRMLEAKVDRLTKERADFEGYYYRPATAKYMRRSKELAEFFRNMSDF